MFWELEGEWTDGLSIISALGLMLSWVRNGNVATSVVHKREVFENIEIWFSNTNIDIALDLWVLEIFFTEIQQAFVQKLRKPAKPRILLLAFLVMYCSGIVDYSDGQLLSAEVVSLNLISFLTQSIQGLMAQWNILAKMTPHQNTSVVFKTCGSTDTNTNLTLCNPVH